MTPRIRRPARVAAVGLAVVLLAAGVALAGVHRSPAAHPLPAAFAWLHPATKPATWKVAKTASGALLAYPPQWRLIHGDPGTASAAPAGPRGAFAGYLNATPRAGSESLANWNHFRVDHVAEEGARNVRLGAAATGLPFGDGRVSCVIDSYSTSKTRFREIACIVTRAQRTSVVVAAAPVRRWSGVAQVLERAITSFSA